MAFGLPTDQRSQVMALLAVAAIAGAYVVWTYVVAPEREQVRTLQVETDSLQRIVDAAKADLAQGTVEDLRRAVADYSASLELARRLVPERNEVPALIDDISTRSKIREITLGTIQPLAAEAGSPFDTHRFRLEVFGHYDQIGEFLSDIASLERIIVPVDLSLKPASQSSQRLLGDTLGGLLVANFTIKTYVKAPAPAPAGGANGTD
ncbi:MAG TPA: type 4a pilus biogenesis protein PilO [Gemmatimonadales bacterium]|nr:type 4a pilus biogenesis protein PilO [Gemmatimonadales bacterium]